MSNIWCCLMYHATPRAEPVDYFGVGGSAFRRQLMHLTASGLHGDSLERCVTGPDAKRVALTFDDAYADNHEVAAPALTEAGMAATVFVVSDWVGRPGYCSWSQLRELHACGWSVQSHTASHPFLSTLAPDALRRELDSSRREIEDRVGAPVTTLALPNGDWPRARWRALVAESGYTLVATSRWRGNTPALPMIDGVRVVNRHTIRRDTTLDRFAFIVAQRPGLVSAEGLRLEVLATARRMLGVERYSRWRHRALGGRDSEITIMTDQNTTERETTA
jgi:peptidoglycan/xylan/chitin deacetylase (PgdA/CDA1 family)